ncbi:MAG: DUF2955 domain-containing protein [Chromatiales bacterium]|nr:DUF2955 domain-containing protein [Chromatiales bacterium]
MSAASTSDTGATLYQRRALRLATGTTLALLFGELAGWNAAFLSAVLAATILALPFPAPTLKAGFSFVLMLAVSLGIGLLLLVPIHEWPFAGVILIGLGLFGIFHYAARGGNPIIAGFMGLGLAVVPALGSESVTAAVLITASLVKSGASCMLFVWIAYAIFPEPHETKAQLAAMRAAKAAAPKPDPRAAVFAALRALFVTFPVLLYFLMAPETSKYMVVLIKSMTLGQQANVGGSAQAARSMLLSTLIGGLAALLIWVTLRIWPSLIVYVLGILIASLFLGRRVFAGKGLAADGPMWSYALVTLLVILGPAVAPTSTANFQFSLRIFLMLVVTVYGIGAMFLFDLFSGQRKRTAAATQSAADAERASPQTAG